MLYQKDGPFRKISTLHTVFCILFSAFLFLINTSSLSASGEWAATYGGGYDNWATSIQQTEVEIGDTSPSGDGDFLILKLTTNGTIEWQKTYGGEDWEMAESIQQTSDGDYIVAGFTSSFGAGWRDLWVLKLRPGGTVKWQKTYGGIYNDVAHSIQQTRNGGYILAGMTSSFSAGEAELWVLKLRSNGTVEWQKTYGGVTHDEAEAIQQTADGGYIVAGYTKSFGAGDADLWVLKLRPGGTPEWQKTYGGGDADVAHSIQQTSDGGYIVAGVTGSFDARLSEVWVLKLRSDGTVEWQKAYGGVNPYIANSIGQTRDGGYIVAGEVWFSNIMEEPMFLKSRPEGSRNFVVKDTNATILDTSARVVSSNTSPRDTWATIQDTGASAKVLFE